MVLGFEASASASMVREVEAAISSECFSLSPDDRGRSDRSDEIQIDAGRPARNPAAYRPVHILS